MIGSAWQRMPGTVLGTAYVLSTCVPHPVQLAGELRSPRAWVTEVGADAAAATLARTLLWLVALWLACGLVALAVSLIPGRLGRLGHAVADRVTPTAMRRAAITAAGTSILLSPVTAAAASVPHGPPVSHGASAVLPALGWPTDPNPTTTTRPAAGTAHDTAASTAAGATAGTSTSTRLAGGERVTVRRGDSLWSLAARRLGATPSPARIQAEWPRWYAVNRQVIGADPNLLHPGASLLVPEPVRTEPGR